MFLIQ